LLLTICSLLFGNTLLFGQTAGELEALLATDEVSYGQAASFVLRAADIAAPGRAFYTMMRTPHYAYRELLRQNIIQGRADSDMAVSGDLLLFIVNRVLEQTEGEP
jgi:hypothetical protein